jgi:hypothetical protein
MHCILSVDKAAAAKVCKLQHEQNSESEVTEIMEDTFEARKSWIVNCHPPVSTTFVPLKDVLSVHVSSFCLGIHVVDTLVGVADYLLEVYVFMLLYSLCLSDFTAIDETVISH